VSIRVYLWLIFLAAAPAVAAVQVAAAVVAAGAFEALAGFLECFSHEPLSKSSFRAPEPFSTDVSDPSR